MKCTKEKRGRLFIFTVLGIAILITLGSIPLQAELIFLKNGSIKKGTIIRDRNISIQVKLENGSVQEINRAGILRVLYTNIYLGKRFIRLTNGESFEAYLVDEDAEHYVFRDDIDKPEEYKIKRGDVLFMTRSNPTGLRGLSYATSISLTWNAPYRPPKRYNVYIKDRRYEKFKKIGSTGRKHYTVRGLKKKTFYYIMVTAIDRDNNESVPSNVIRVKTNIPPVPPKDSTITKKKDKLGKRLTVTLIWDKSEDQDGRVTGYAVYQRKGKRLKEMAKTGKNSYTITGLDSEKDHEFIIRAVDNDGRESDDITLTTGSPVRFRISAQGLYAYPLRNFGTIARHGFGGIVKLDLVNAFARGLTFGIGAGCIYFMGKGDMDREFMMPAFLSIGYNFKISRSFYIAPFVSGGAAYSVIYAMKERIPLTFNADMSIKTLPIERMGQKRGFTPLVSGGLEFAFILKNNLLINIKAEYWALIEKSAIMDFVSGTVGLGLRF